MPSHPPQIEPGMFVETTTVYDSNTFETADINSPEFRNLLIKLRQSVNKISTVINYKDTGIYPLTEFVCGKTWFPDPAVPVVGTPKSNRRQVFRKSYYYINAAGLPALPANVTIPHNLNISLTANAVWTFTDIIATTNDVLNHRYYGIPYIDNAAGNNISIMVDNTDIIINTVAGYPTCTITYITLEYIKT